MTTSWSVQGNFGSHCLLEDGIFTDVRIYKTQGGEWVASNHDMKQRFTVLEEAKAVAVAIYLLTKE